MIDPRSYLAGDMRHASFYIAREHFLTSQACLLRSRGPRALPVPNGCNIYYKISFVVGLPS